MSGPFLVGANLPWIRYGCDFGANRWQPEGGLAASGRAAAAREVLHALAGRGAQAVRWFLLCDARAGVRFDDRGEAAGIDDRVFADLDVAIELLGEARLPAIFVLVDFIWFSRRRMVNGVPLGGRGRLISDPSARSRLLDRVFAPILARYGQSDAVIAWDIINEPDWALTRLPRLRRGALAHDDLCDFVRETAALVHGLTRHAATVGTARPATLLRLQGIGLDFYQVHWYDKWRCRFDLAAPATAMRADGPVLLGEFPVRRSPVTPESILDTAQQAGYSGALGWSACAKDRWSDRRALEATIEQHTRGC